LPQFDVSSSRSQDSEEREMKKKLIVLQRQMEAVNTPSTFHEAAKLQRQINALKDQLALHHSATLSSPPKASLLVPYWFLMIIRVVGPFLILTIWWRDPIVQLTVPGHNGSDEKLQWLFPVSSFFSSPGWELGTVGIVAWSFICHRVVGLFSR